MPACPFHRFAALALAAGLAGLAPTAQALDIVFKDVGATPMSGQQFSAFQTAAGYWTRQLTDDVTVYINVAFDDLGNTTLGSTTWSQYQLGYGTLRGRLAGDATTAVDASAVSHLQAGPALSFIATQPDLSTRLDNDGSVNNRQLKLTTANAKALGVTDTATDAGSPDATIKFANAFADNFAFSRDNGQVPADKIDFITVAQHEIGHALGFVSGVDSIDNCIGNAAQCGTANGFDGSAWYYSLDLFRYSATNTLNVAVGGDPAPYLSVDGGATQVLTFSTGKQHGDGNQASHFGTGNEALMGPFVYYGRATDATAADLLAMDAIGWDLTAAVPEPQTYALWLGGLAVLGWARSRRRAACVSA